MKADKVYLVGFMGAGKTTIAQALGARLGWRIEDVDERIEAREHRLIARIFADQGESYFRSVERDVVRELIPERQVVVATGGGTFAEPENRSAILADGAVVWIDVPLETILSRLPADGRRPLAADRSQMEALYQRRILAYRQAHLRIEGARAAVPEVVERIIEWLEP